MKSEGTQITCDFWGRAGGKGDEEDPGKGGTCLIVILAPARAPAAPMRPKTRRLVSVHEKTRRHHGLTQRAPRRHP